MLYNIPLPNVRRTIIIRALYFLAIVGLPASANAGTFTFHSYADELTGETLRNIQGEQTPTTKVQEFPYSDLKAALQVNCSGDEPALHIRFSTAPNLTDSDTENRYSKNALEYAIDGRLYKSDFLQPWGADSLSSNAKGQLLARLEGANTLTLRMNWYGLGRVHFKFDTEGLWNASADLLDQCGKQIPKVARPDRCAIPEVYALNELASTWDLERSVLSSENSKFEAESHSDAKELSSAERKARRKAKWKAKRKAAWRNRNKPKCRKY